MFVFMMILGHVFFQQIFKITRYVLLQKEKENSKTIVLMHSFPHACVLVLLMNATVTAADIILLFQDSFMEYSCVHFCRWGCLQHLLK
jgi:hypothetical protein